MNQRKCIKFCAKTSEMLTVAFGESTLTGLRKTEKMSMIMLALVGRARQQSIEAVKKMVLDNRRISIREVADHVGISFGSCQAIFFLRMF